MRDRLQIVFLALVAAAAFGCFTPQSYVNPQYQNAEIDSIRRLAQPIPVKVDAHFQRNGEALSSLDGDLREPVVSALQSTGVFAPTADASAIIDVTGNNIADMDQARSKGFTTGFTFGGVGTMIDDNYEFSFSYTNSAGRDQKTTYRHAIHSTIGNASGPEGLTPTSLEEAFRQVVTDVVLNFVKDLQDAGIVPSQ